jgi:hypothetical protein
MRRCFSCRRRFGSFALVTRNLCHKLRQRRMSGATGASADVPPPPFLFHRRIRGNLPPARAGLKQQRIGSVGQEAGAAIHIRGSPVAARSRPCLARGAPRPDLGASAGAPFFLVEHGRDRAARASHPRNTKSITTARADAGMTAKKTTRSKIIHP